MPFKRTIPRECEACGKPFMAAPERPRYPLQRFCNLQCKGKGLKRSPEAILTNALTRLDYSAPNGCRIWTGGTRNEHGYGGIWDGESWEYTHRYFYRAIIGPIPDGLDVLHHCDNPPCCYADPDPSISHLFAGTALDNSHDMLAKGRHPKGALTPPERRQWGEAHHNARLTEAAVRDIRTGRLSRHEFAALYNVSPSTIADAANRKTWPHI